MKIWNDNELRDWLKQAKSIAVVGASLKPERPSHTVAEYLMRHGYKMIPVNPGMTSLLGETAYSNLLEVPEKIDIVNVFRAVQFVPSIVEEAITCGAKGLWLQVGIVNEIAAKRAEDAGLKVMMDRCLMVEHERLCGQ